MKIYAISLEQQIHGRTPAPVNTIEFLVQAETAQGAEDAAFAAYPDGPEVTYYLNRVIELWEDDANTVTEYFTVVNAGEEA